MKAIPKIYFGVLVLLIASLTFSYKINSLCIIALLLVWLAEAGFARKFKILIREPFFILNSVLFGLYLVSIAVSEDKSTARFFVEKNLSLVALPMIMLSMKRLTQNQFFILGKVFVSCTCALMSLATIFAVRQWFAVHQSDVFFYHKLAQQVGLSAIIASLLCIAGVAVLFALPGFGWKKGICVSVLSVWLILLSSKLFLFMLGVILLINVLKYIKTRGKVLILSAITVVILLIAFIQNPVRKRFEDMGKFHAGYLSAEMYDPGMYFDGLSMRLIWIKFGFEIFKEQGNYLFGTGTGDAEHLLKEKIKAYNMYQGDGIKDKEGYLQYGYHNQLLQKLLQLGISGFAVFMAIITYCYAMAIKYKNKFLVNLMIIFTLTFFTDTLLEHQVGLVMFLTFTCLAISQIRNRQTENLDPAQSNLSYS